MATSRTRFLADENFNNDLLRAILRALPSLDVVRVQDTAIAGADDPALLAWAASEGRILLAHDVRTIPRFAYERIRTAQPLLGVVIVSAGADLGEVLDDLILMIAASRDDEWPSQVRFAPLG